MADGKEDHMPVIWEEDEHEVEITKKDYEADDILKQADDDHGDYELSHM